MGRPTVDDVRNLGDFQENFRWNMYFQFPEAIKAKIDLDAVEMNIRCVSVEVPKRPNTGVDIQLRGLTIPYPGISKPTQTMSMTLLETTNPKVRKLIKAAREVLWTPFEGKAQPVEKIRGVIIINQLDRNDDEIYQYRLEGAYIEDGDSTGGTLNENQGESKPTLTIRYIDFTEQSLV